MTQGDQNVLFDYAPFGKSFGKTSMVDKTKVMTNVFFLCIFGGLCCEILKFCTDDTKANTYITGKAFYLNTRNALICREPDDIVDTWHSWVEMSMYF